MWPSKLSRSLQLLILKNSQTKQIIYLFPIFYNISTASIFGTNWQISIEPVLWKVVLQNDVSNQSEKWKLNLTDFRLILLDCLI